MTDLQEFLVLRGFSTNPTAEGMWLILAVEVTNETGDLALLPRRLLKVTDAQGREYTLEGMAVHGPHIWADERWMKQENQLIQNVMDAGAILEGPLIYEVPEDATGLKLVMEGAEETVDLGL